MQIGNYKIQQELGRGGMGVVYRALETSLNRIVALKMLNQGVAHQADLVARFYREAKAMAQLSDPNVVQIFSVGEHQGQPYFAMEFVDGESLSARLKLGRLGLAEARKILRQAASGLQAAHEQGLIHRDVKPGNLMITPRGVVKVTDFGIALAQGTSERLTGTGGVVGTPGYLSPEACLGQPIDARTDIFALGVVFFEMLSGNLPFDDSSPYALIAAVVQAQIPDITQINREVDAHTAAILRKMLERTPEARYQSCAALMEDLDQPAHLPLRHARPASPAALALTLPVTPPPITASPAATPLPPPNFAPSFAPHLAANLPPQFPGPPAPVFTAQPAQSVPGPNAPSSMPPRQRSNWAPMIIGLTVLIGGGYWGISKLAENPEFNPEPPNPFSGQVVTSPAPSRDDQTPGKPGFDFNADGTCRSDLAETQLEPLNAGVAAEELLGTYSGLISEKPFKLVLQNNTLGSLAGYNIADKTRRPVCGYVVNISDDTDADGDEWKVYRVIFKEPGGESNDGEFALSLRHSEQYIAGSGTWNAFSGKETLDIEIKRFNGKIE